MIDWIIKKLGGITQEELAEEICHSEEDCNDCMENIVDVGTLVREQLIGIDDGEDEYFKNMTTDQKKAYLADIYLVSKNKSFYRMLKELTKSQTYKTIKDATDTEQLNFGRATINGFALIEKHIDNLSSQYEDTIKPMEEFDKHEAI